MNQANITADKSYAFAIRIVKLFKSLKEEKREYNLSKQVLRSVLKKNTVRSCIKS
ncbi:MAG: four helix bundle protein [Candidatus Cloacimonetes bacterium]|nr:four helix bundle protein [Candidatus Cloacimonadota bacterium]